MSKNDGLSFGGFSRLWCEPTIAIHRTHHCRVVPLLGFHQVDMEDTRFHAGQAVPVTLELRALEDLDRIVDQHRPNSLTGVGPQDVRFECRVCRRGWRVVTTACSSG